MNELFSGKKGYFLFFGGLGGLLSALLYKNTSIHGTPTSDWAFGVAYDGMSIAGMLAIGQVRYLGKFFDVSLFVKALVIGGIGGLIGGIISPNIGFPLAQMFGASHDLGRFVGWSIAGAVVGIAVSKVVPNLMPKTAAIAGGVGGAGGCGLMYILSSFEIGTMTTGASIGLAIALAEGAFRSSWLDIIISTKKGKEVSQRTASVTLGEKPILFGCTSDVDVKLLEMDGAQAHFAKVELKNSKVYLTDLSNNKVHEISVNQEFNISNAAITLRSK